LADVEELKTPAAIDDIFDALTRNTNATPYGEEAKLKKVQAYTSETAIGDRGAAEGEIEACQVSEAQSQDFSRSV